jgi:hypothetical protein
MWAALKKVVVTPDDQIYAIGEFYGCMLEFERNNAVQGIAVPTTNQDVHRVFLVHYDAQLDYVSSQIFTPDGPCVSGTYSPPAPGGMRNATAADVALGIQDINNAVFIGANFCGTHVIIENFGASLAPSTGLSSRPINVGQNNQFQIIIAQLDYTVDQVVDAVEIGNEFNDFVSELASGYYYGATDLYIAGSFESSIDFFKTSTFSTTTYMSNGPSDAFACRFDNMDLLEQSPVIAGGTGPDQGLSLSDDGLMVGGYVTDQAVFPGHGTLTLNPVTTLTSAPRVEGFIAIPDYDNANWEWATNIVNGPPSVNCFNSMVNELAGSCDEVYAVFTRGMRMGFGGFMDEPEHEYSATTLPEQGNAPNHTDRMAYSRLEKWHHQGTTATQIWDYDLLPDPPMSLVCAFTGGTYNFPGSPHRKVQLIEDIHVRSEQYFDPREDVAITGWFGTQISVPFVPGATINNFYDGSGAAPYAHDENGMFLLTMDEIPELSFNQLEACIYNDPFIIDWSFLPSPFNWTQSGITVNIIGPGITDPTTGEFDPSIAGIGVHTIILELDYYGCLYEFTIAEVEVYADELYPRQPTVSPGDWSEGLAAEGVTDQELASMLAQGSELFGEELSYLAGRFINEIEFERFNDPTDPITLTAQGGGEAGYIVAYGPCGAYWALRIDAAGADYIESLKITSEFINADQIITWLYAAGGVDGTATGVFEIEHSEDPLLVPTAAVNGTYPINTGAVTYNEKGVVMRIHPLTGEVDWVYLGGDNPANENRFHGLATIDDLVAAVGEWSTSYHDPVNTVTTANYGGFDPFFVVLQDNGTFAQHSILNPTNPDGFGTPNDDRGDAIDVTSTADGPLFYMAGEFDFAGGGVANSLNQNFIGLAGGLIAPPVTTPTAQTDVFVSAHQFELAINAIEDELLKVYNDVVGSPGPDRVNDIRLASSGGTLPSVAFGNNQVFICGSFEDDFTHDFATMTSWPGASDIFIGSLELNLSDNWFSHEGSGNFFAEESANALEIIGNDVAVYGTRTSGGGLTSILYPGGFAGTGTLNAYFPTVTAGQNEIFASVFSPTGLAFEFNATDPTDIGLHAGNDITSVSSNNTRVAGTIVIPNASNLVEFSDQMAVTHHSLVGPSGLRDAYLGRLELGVGLGYYKNNDYSQNLESQFDQDSFLRVYPNPSSSGFTLELIEPIPYTLSVYDGTGRRVLVERVDQVESYHFGESLGAGIYLLEVQSLNESMNLRLVVN